MKPIPVLLLQIPIHSTKQLHGTGRALWCTQNSSRERKESSSSSSFPAAEKREPWGGYSRTPSSPVPHRDIPREPKGGQRQQSHTQLQNPACSSRTERAAGDAALRIHSHPGSALPATPEPPGSQHCSW